MRTTSTTTTPIPTTTSPITPTTDRTWRDVLRGAAVGQAIMAAFMAVITLLFEGRLDPMPLVIGVIVSGGVVWLRRSEGRGGVVYAGIVSLLLFAMVAMFGGLTVLTRAESTFELILFGGLFVVSVLGLVATVGALRRQGGPMAGVAPKVAGAVIAVLVVVGIVAGSLTGSATRMPGDLTLQAKNFEFSASTLDADAGRITVFVENDDVAHHDFTINGVVAEQVPGQKAGRAEFDLEAGAYRFYCSLHPDMEGTLKVS